MAVQKAHYPVSDLSKVISFTKVDLPYGWLGNMSGHPVRHDDKDFRTTEALFQYLRFEGFPEIQEEIRLAKSPMSAKMIAKLHKSKLVGVTELLGEEDLARMKLCLHLKVDAYGYLRLGLKETRGKVLIEDVTKRRGGTGEFWGCSWNENTQTWIGQNWLGKVWMEVRDELFGSV